MSKTYRTSSSGGLTGDGGRHYAIPRYRPGSRRKPHRLVARAIRRDQPDLERFGEAVVRAALSQAEQPTVETGVRRSDRPLTNRRRPLPPRTQGQP